LSKVISLFETVSELTELFTIVGTPGKHEQVTKLWYGFRKSIQKALYTAKLNPETSRWKEIVREAEYHEMAERVDLDDDSPSNTHKSRFGGNGNNGRHGEGGQLRMEATTDRAAIMLTVGNVTMSNPRGTQALTVLASLHMDGVPTRDLVACRSVGIHL